MSARSFLVAVFVAALSACATPDAPAPRVAHSDAPAVVRAGELTLARGRFAFAPCDGKVAAAIDATPGLELAALLHARNAGGDGAIFLVAEIAHEPDGRWRIDHVRRAYRDGPRCAEPTDAFIWSARGAGWSLQATSRWVTLRLRDEEPLRFRFRPFAPDGEGNYVFSGTSPRGAANVVMAQRRCVVDGDALEQYTARITIAGRVLEGCAWNGAASPPPDGGTP